MELLGIVLIVVLVVVVMCIAGVVAWCLCKTYSCFEVPVEHHQDVGIRTTTPEERSERRPLLRSGSSTACEEGGVRKNDIVAAASPHECLRRDFGYEFKEGRLVDTNTGSVFKFKSQDEYEQIGKVVDEYIYGLLEGQDLKLRMLEDHDVGARPRGFYFASRNIDSNANGILVLIHGTGVVRAGQWSRRLIINHSLESGSQLPYIEEAKKRNWSVVVMNTNQKNDSYSWYKKGVFFEGYEPGDHGVRVWRDVIERSPARHIAIVAHSYGGHVTSCVLRKMGPAFKKKVFAIALTDSFCSVESSDQAYFKKVARNWVTSQLPVGDSVGYAYDCERVSAGTSVHEETSWKSMKSVFAFLDKKFLAAAGDRKASVGIEAQSGNAQETLTGAHPRAMPYTYRQEDHDDLSTQAQSKPEIEDVVNVPSLGSSRNCKVNPDVKAVMQSTSDIPAELSDDESCTAGCRLGADSLMYDIDVNGQKQRHTISQESFRQASSKAEEEECHTGKVTVCDPTAAVAGQSTKTSLDVDNIDPFGLRSETPKENFDTMVETYHSTLDLAMPVTINPMDDFLLVHRESENHDRDKPVESVVNEGTSEGVKISGEKVYRSSISDGDIVPENGCTNLCHVNKAECLLSGATAGAMPQQQSGSHEDESRLKQPPREVGVGSLVTANNSPTSGRAAVELMDCGPAKMDAVTENVSDSPEVVIEQPGTDLSGPEHKDSPRYNS